MTLVEMSDYILKWAISGSFIYFIYLLFRILISVDKIGDSLSDSVKELNRTQEKTKEQMYIIAASLKYIADFIAKKDNRR